MTAHPFPTALQMATERSLSLTDLLESATRLTASNRTDLSRQLYQTWIKENPVHPQVFVALFNCSALDSQAGDTAAAMEALRQSIAKNADFLPAYINLGSLLERSGSPAQAIELWRTAANRPLAINGNGVAYTGTALKQIARVLSDRQQLEPAETIIRLAIDIDPHQTELIEQYVAIRLAQCKWPIVVPWERIDRKTLMRGIHPLSTAAYTDDPLLQLASANRYVRASSAEGPQDPAFDRRDAPIALNGRRLRIGYVSSDLRDHAIGYLMAEFFELHDKKKVEVFAYDTAPESNSPLRTRIKDAAEHWTAIRQMSNDEAAQRIADDGIDILVDVNGHTRDARMDVFARRPAPIQINWLGFPGTMGTPYHQYIIADDWIIPEEAENYYSEKVLRLPCYQPNDRKRAVAADRPSRSEAGLPSDAFVFCCFNGSHKINRFTFARWLEILSRVEGSVLWLLDTIPETKARLAEFAETKGIAANRIVFAPKLQNSHHLARYRLADLFLDTSPYGAHTTASDALWMGVPVLTLSGRSFASRVCGSLVKSAGLDDLVVANPRDYVERAVQLGNDRASIDAYKRQLEENRHRCRLFDTDLLVRSLEDLYRKIAIKHQEGNTPQPNLVNLDAYLEAGIEHDHEQEEMLAVSDYEARYKQKLARLHRARPLQPDQRLWTKNDIARADSRVVKISATENPVPARRTQAPSRTRKTGTDR
jgi:predicted O-linked N-acetylglucosamine transferase (SPINDLY family)